MRASVPMTNFILLGAAPLFLVAALISLRRSGWKSNPAARTWLLIALVFAAVGTWLTVSA